MRFDEYKYIRPNYDKYKNEMNRLIKEFEEAETFECCDKKLMEINSIKNEIETNKALVYIRQNIDTADQFYAEELKYWDEISPFYEETNNQYFKTLVNSKFRKDFEEKYGEQLFRILELRLKGFSSEIIEEVQIENQLVSEYKKLVASAKINFMDEEMNLSSLGKYIQSNDRNTREAANLAYWKFFSDNEKEFDRIYDELVKIRHKMAKKLGYKNYVELGYIRRSRIDFNAEMVDKFRAQVKEYIVPITMKLYERQRERLKLDKLEYYDLPVEFTGGNAMVKGNSKWIIENANNMYSELSKETKEFFQYMVENQLMDLETKKGKVSGAYCEFLANYDTTFIFSNFNGTSGDVDILTHEVGHAFQAYTSVWHNISELKWPTFEAAEIYSMSMEFLTLPWIKNFFLEDSDKYKFIHLSFSLKVVPYITLVDHFQHFIYENPNATSMERRAIWRNLEKEYLPHKSYKGNEFLENGGYWFKQRHIFEEPFYYIDYALAQICAYQFWKKSSEDREECWKDYMKICIAGGTKSFLELVELANLKSPFDEECISSVIGHIERCLDSIML